MGAVLVGDEGVIFFGNISAAFGASAFYDVQNEGDKEDQKCRDKGDRADGFIAAHIAKIGNDDRDRNEILREGDPSPFSIHDVTS